jgi:hypothetical protein
VREVAGIMLRSLTDAAASPLITRFQTVSHTTAALAVVIGGV